MKQEERLQRLLDEEKFPHEGMGIEERDYYLNIIKHCKDICDTDHPFDECSNCVIVQMGLKKTPYGAKANGSLVIGNQVREHRFIDADIFVEKNRIVVDMLVEILNKGDENKKYRVLDEFYLENENLKRRSQYNYNMKSIYTEVNDEEMKGRLK